MKKEEATSAIGLPKRLTCHLGFEERDGHLMSVVYHCLDSAVVKLIDMMDKLNESFIIEKWAKKRKTKMGKREEQGRIHGHQLRTGGQGRKCVFSHFSTRWLRTDRRTDGRTKPLIELRVRN